jgi:hypothetical protein
LAWSVAVEATWLPACAAVWPTFLASSTATSLVSFARLVVDEEVGDVEPVPGVAGGGSGASME